MDFLLLLTTDRFLKIRQLNLSATVCNGKKLTLTFFTQKLREINVFRNAINPRNNFRVRVNFSFPTLYKKQNFREINLVLEQY